MKALTKYQEKLVGIKYKTKEGSEITVKGVADNECRRARYTFECSVCSKDAELFPCGELNGDSSTIHNSRTPCACGRSYKWSKRQYLIRISRRCNLLNYRFEGFVGEYSGCNTKLILFNPKTGNKWESSSIQTFLLVGVRDPEEFNREGRGVSCTKEDTYHTDKFFSTGAFLEGTIFTRLSGDKWEYTCPKCSNDKYVKANLCSGVFKASSGHLAEGKSSCRCKKGAFRWTQGQREYQVTVELDKIGGSFIAWVNGAYKNTESKFIWTCKEGHTTTNTFANFINRHSCSNCSGNGYNSVKGGTLYIVRWSGEGSSYLKFGITNKTIESRIKSQNAVSPLHPKILHAFYSSEGSVVQSCEKAIKSEFGDGPCPRELLPRGFTETAADTEDNLSKMLNIISTFNLT